jgi:hypothetical protein
MLNKLVFIIGVGRSGTTLLQSLLHGHSSIHFTPETHFVKKYLSKASSVNPALSKQKYLIEKIKADTFLKEISENLLEYCAQAISDESISNKVAWIFVQLLKEKSGNSVYLGDKDPMNVNYLKQIKSVYPDSKIIHIIRDPRDVVLSRMKSAWGKKNRMASHIAEYIHGIDKARIDGTKNFGENYVEIRYEQLIENPTSTIEQLCSFLEIPFQESMMNHQVSSKELVRADEGEWKSNVLQPVISENSAKWQKECSKAQIEKMEFALKKTLEDLGYLKSTDKRGFKEVLFSVLVGFYHIAFTLRFY